MDSLHFIGFILMLSILFQMVSAVMAIRLINISGKRTAWIFITVAIVLMAVRRMIPFMRILTGDQSVHPDLLNEIIGLVISVFMAVGIAFIAPLFIERKRVEGRIRQLNTELEEHVAQRTAQLEAANKELEAFAYSVAHDLRSPLRGVEGFSQILLEEYHDKLDKQGKNYLRRLTSAAHRMDQLIDDLLNL